MKIYQHKTQYYETDQMGIVHHSNYIRWFEEARTDLMEQLGMGYDRMEAEGIISPVLEVNCQYKSMTRSGETVSIETRVEKYNGIRLELSYEVKNAETGEIRAVGNSKHCFLDREGNLLSLKHADIPAHNLFLSAMQKH